MSPRTAAVAFVPDSGEAWIRLSIVLLIGAIGAVGMWSVVVVLPAAQADFGASRAAASLAFTLTMAGFGLGSVVTGRLCDRFGLVAAIGFGAVLTGLGYLGTAAAGSLGLFVALHAVIGLGASATFGPLMTEAARWFDRRRGLAVTIAASGNYVGGALWPPLVSFGIEHAGWRTTNFAIGIAVMLAMGLAVWLLQRRTRGEALRADAKAPVQRVDLRLGGNALTAVLAVAAVACCVAMAMPQVHIVAYCGDLGYGPARGAEMLSLMMALGIVSRIGSGYLADRIGGVPTLLIGSVAQGVALLFYLFFTSLPSLYLISAMFGLFQGGIVPSYAIIMREALPARDIGTRVGLVLLASVIGMSLGGWVSGVIFDMTGSYAAAFVHGLVWNAINILICIALLLRGRRLAGVPGHALAA